MLLPIIVVMLMQSGIVGLFLVFSGTVGALNDSSIGIIKNNVEFRGTNLQDLMLNSWSNLDAFEYAVESSLAAFLSENNIGVNELLDNRQKRNSFLYGISDEVVNALHIADTTGAFIYILDGICPSEGGTRSLNGIYIRDLSVLPNIPANHIFLVGHYSISRKHGFSQDALWTENFTFSPEHYEMWRGFAYPQLAAKAMPGASSKDVSFWNPTHYFNPGSPASTSQISYSRIVFFENQPFAIIGTDVRLSTLMERHMPMRDFEYFGESGYALVLGSLYGCEQNIVDVSGMFLRELFDGLQSITMQETRNSGVYSIYELPSNSMVYRPLDLYNATSYFFNQRWALAAVSTNRALFSVSQFLLNMMIAGMVIAVILGVVLVVITVRHVTKPIGLITTQLMEKGDKEIIVHKSSSAEIELLYNTINDITNRRIEAEQEIREERQRYLLALESSADTFIEYNLELDILQVMYFTSSNKHHPNIQIVDDFSKKMGDIFHPDDEPEFFIKKSHELRVKTELFSHIKNTEDIDGYIWVSVKTIFLKDDKRKTVKIIGTARDITRKKISKLNEIETNRRDMTSGFYNRVYGTKLVNAFAKDAANRDAPFYLKLLRIKNFHALELRFGQVFGGIFIAMFGALLKRRFFMGHNFVTRLGNSEFLVYHESHFDESEFISEFNNLYAGEESNIGISIQPVIYSDDMKWRRTKDPIKVSLNMSEKANIADIAMELLERSPHIDSSIKALLGLTARLFGLERIVICNYNAEFSTDQISIEWNETGGKINSERTNVSAKAFKRFSAMLDEENHTMTYTNEKVSFNELNELLHVSPGERVSIFCCMVHEGAENSGRIMFMKDDFEWSDEDKDILRTLVKVISAYMDMEKNRSASRAKSNFLSRVSHEIRTPMNAIIGMTDIAKDAANNGNADRTLDCLNKIDISASHLLNLINDVLEMSRIESGKVLNIEKIPFSLEKLIDETESIIRYSIENKKIKFNVNRSFENKNVIGDPKRIKQVLINLLGNANKFTPQEGSITFSVIENDSMYEFCVRDTGIGIPLDKQSIVFNAFEQAENTSAEQNGTGLGLSISRNIIRAMDSDIILNSEIGFGSEFKFKLNLPHTGIPIEEEIDVADYKDLFVGKRALVVDDVEINLEIAEFILKNAGFETVTAINGKEAVDKFYEAEVGYFDVILMDIQMPVMDGITAATYIRGTKKSDSKKIPIIALTANAFDEDWKKSTEAGMDVHINKPIDSKVLLAMLKQIL